MEDSKPPTDQVTDWRQHLHSLPSEERPFPTWVRWLFIAPALIFSGAVVAILGGAFLGMALGVGPDDTGGTVWLVSGFLPVFALGGLLAYVGKRRGHSQASCRAAFYLFTLPAWLFVLYFIWKVVEHFL